MQETDDGQAPEKKKIGRPREGRKMLQTSITLSEGDVELIQFIKNSLGGTSQAEAIRVSLRAYAMHLERILGK